MNKLFICLAISAAITFAGCKKEGCTDPLANNYDEKAKLEDGTCVFDAPKASFYTSQSGHGQIEVYIDQQFVGNISNYFPAEPPECNESGTVTVQLEHNKTYTYDAVAQDGTVWYGSITVPNYTYYCETFLLY